MSKLMAGLVYILVLHIGTAYALRCGTEVVSIRDPKIEVLRKCGDPVSVEAWTEHQVISRNHTRGRRYSVLDDIVISISVEEWLYNFGPHRLIYWLRIENGYLDRMGTLGYGYLERQGE